MIHRILILEPAIAISIQRSSVTETSDLDHHRRRRRHHHHHYRLVQVFLKQQISFVRRCVVLGIQQNVSFIIIIVKVIINIIIIIGYVCFSSIR